MDMEIEDMDMQYALEASNAASLSDRPLRPLVQIDDAHPFDLDGYISSYSGALLYH